MESELLMAAATTMINSLVEEVFVPMIKKFQKSAKITSAEFLNRNKGYFNEYLLRTYNKYSIINTMVFHNSQRSIKDIYVPQTLVKEHPTEDKKETAKIDRLPVSLIKKYKKLLITDTAGMGKSTIMKRMFIDLIDDCIKDVGIPIYIELNRLNKDRTIIVEIQEELNSLSEEFDCDLLLSFIQKGGFIFFLDGYDEISIADRDAVTQDIKDFISRASTGNYFILTSRPESSLSGFGDFQLFRIQPLTKDEAFELLGKYDLSKNKDLSENLVKLLKSGQYDSLDEFLENPLLVSLLFTAYDYNRSIPFEKHRFYGVVFEAYFEKHDLSKPLKFRDKLSGLNYDGFDRILRYLGYDCLINTGVKFNKDTILNTIRKAKDFCGISNFSENAFLEDLVSTVPLFCKERTDYKWVHKSLLEYFAARFIFCDAKENQDRILTAIYNSERLDKYINMLDLYYDIDLKGFSKNITLPLCKQYINYYKNNWIDLNIKSRFIEERIGLSFIGNQSFMIGKEGTLFHLSNICDLFEDPYIYDSIGDLRLFGTKVDRRLEQILILLEKKIPSLFQKIDTDFNFNSLRNMIEKDKPFTIDVRTGEESDELYSLYNSLLEREHSWFLSYKACIFEEERITRENKSVNSFLFENI